MNINLFGKKLNILILASLIALVLLACGGGDEAPVSYTHLTLPTKA